MVESCKIKSNLNVPDGCAMLCFQEEYYYFGCVQTENQDYACDSAEVNTTMVLYKGTCTCVGRTFICCGDTYLWSNATSTVNASWIGYCF